MTKNPNISVLKWPVTYFFFTGALLILVIQGLRPTKLPPSQVLAGLPLCAWRMRRWHSTQQSLNVRPEVAWWSHPLISLIRTSYLATVNFKWVEKLHYNHVPTGESQNIHEQPWWLSQYYFLKSMGLWQNFFNVIYALIAFVI